MPGILGDLRTGNPVLVDGDFVEVKDDYAFYQIIDNLLNCQVGTERFNVLYGFDLETALRMCKAGVPEEMIESLLIEALDPNKERLIASVESIQVTRDGREVNAEIRVKSKLGQEIILTQTISDLSE